MSFRLKVIGIVAFGCIVCTASAVYVASHKTHENAVEALVEKSDAILSRLEAARAYVAEQGLLDEAIRDTVKKYPDGQLPKEEKLKILKLVPIYASLKIGAEMAEKDHYEFRVASKDARRKENEIRPDELKHYARFEADKDLKEIVNVDEDAGFVEVMRPIYISKAQGCLNCHGHPSTSPWGNGKDVLGIEMENWPDGQLHGMFKITSSLKPVQAATAATTKEIMFWGLGIFLSVIGIVVLLLAKPIQTLLGISSSLKAAGDANSASSQKLRESAQGVSAASAEQASAIQETVASMTEMNSMISRSSELVSQTENTTQLLSQTTAQGAKVMEGMVGSMQQIKEANEKLNTMVQIINDISSKTKVINDIVFKTQLLSVNASIEAARAGQHGKGFAVVAEEVGNLAQTSGKAAEEIRELLDKSQRHVGEIVTATNSKVSEGEKVTRAALDNFTKIAEGIKTIQEYSSHVAEATNQQKEGIAQISAAMAQMDTASQQNNQMAESVSQLAENLYAQSESLEQLNLEMHNLVVGASKLSQQLAPVSSIINNFVGADATSGEVKVASTNRKFKRPGKAARTDVSGFESASANKGKDERQDVA